MWKRFLQKTHKDKQMKTLKQLITEFWIPLAAACIWTFINFYNKEYSSLSFVKIVNIFGPSFFLASWLSGQYFRVTRQAKVEGNLEKIEKRADDILNSLEARTGLIFSQITGGNSFCFANLSQNYLGERNLTVTHQGDYSLYDLSVRVVDLEKFNEHSGNLEYAHIFEKIFSIGTMLPKQFNNLCSISISDQEYSKSFNIFFSARNGMFHELLRLKKINNEWVSAIKVDREKTLLECFSDNYPKNTAGEIDW